MIKIEKMEGIWAKANRMRVKLKMRHKITRMKIKLLLAQLKLVTLRIHLMIEIQNTKKTNMACNLETLR